MNHTEHLTEPWTRIHLYFDTSSLFFKTRRKEGKLQEKLKQAIFCCLQWLVKLTPIFGLQWGQWHRQSSSALGRIKLSAAIRCAGSMHFMFLSIYVYFSLSVMADNFPSLQHACTFICLFDQLVVLLPMVFLTVYYIIPYETEQACPAFLSLFTAFSAAFCVPFLKSLLSLTIYSLLLWQLSFALL